MKNSMKRKLVIRALFAGLAVLTSSLPASHAAPRVEKSPFDGDWRGSIHASNDSDIRIRIIIKQEKATIYHRSEDKWVEFPSKKNFSSRLQDIFIFGWINNSEIWTENQTFSLSIVNSSKLKVFWMRHVTNREKDKESDPWSLTGSGDLVLVD